MKNMHRLLIALAACLLLAVGLTGAAMAESTSNGLFPEGTVVVPMGTGVVFSQDDDCVVIYDSDVQIQTGDTFVVYLQDLPIGYVAKDVHRDDNAQIVQVEKAGKEIYALLEEEGSIDLSSANSSFLPSDEITGRTARGVKVGTLDLFEYTTDGVLKIKYNIGDGSIDLKLSNIRLNHTIAAGNINMSLSADWSLQGSPEIDIPLGEMRIGGVGFFKVELCIKEELENASISGTYIVGLRTENGSTKVLPELTISHFSFDTGASVSIFLRFKVGFDILFADAYVYAEVGVKTDIRYQWNWSEEKEKTVRCEDYQLYGVLNVGATVHIMDNGEQMRELLTIEDEIIDPNDPKVTKYILHEHYEDGERVSQCFCGMEMPEIERSSIVALPAGTYTDAINERILETDIDLIRDVTVNNLQIAHGTLNLDGKTLTVNGDLLVSGGTLMIGSGKLIVKGDLRLQGHVSGTSSYGDSTGALNMTNGDGVIEIDGDMIVQSSSTSHNISAGTILLKGNFYQYDPGEGAHFNTGSSMALTMDGDHTHTMYFADAANNAIGWLNMLGPVTVTSDGCFGKIDMNGRKFVINGTLTSTDRVDMQDYDQLVDVYTYDGGDVTLTGDVSYDSDRQSRALVLGGYTMTVNGDFICRSDVDIDGGTLKVTGTLYQQGGTIALNGGTLNVEGSYYQVGSDSNFEREEYTYASAYLIMSNANDIVKVGGNFIEAASTYNYANNNLTAGVMYIGGNFRQVTGNTGYYGSSNFSASGSHKVVFNGSGTQSIQFSSNSSGFNVVQFTNKNIELKGNYLRGFTLEQDINLTLSTDTINFAGTMDVNGHSLGISTISGDMTISGGTFVGTGLSLTITGNFANGTTINMDASRLTVNGNMTSTGDMDLYGSTLTVKKTLYQQGGVITVNGGTLNVGGSYYQVGSDSNFEREEYTYASAYLI
ncbi:MAG: hypothetical protein E7317_11275, partial [Clostridiales bacterium]|nr:hypothetical protein [Clostridiales bacterium]